MCEGRVDYSVSIFSNTISLYPSAWCPNYWYSVAQACWVSVANPANHHTSCKTFINFDESDILVHFFVCVQGYDDLLVLSLGTGNYVHSYNADQVSKWGVIDWLRNEGEAPLVDMVFSASADMVDYNLNIIFNSQDSSHNYLRIQVCHLHRHMISICFRMSWNFTLGSSRVECLARVEAFPVWDQCLNDLTRWKAHLKRRSIAKIIVVCYPCPIRFCCLLRIPSICR